MKTIRELLTSPQARNGSVEWIGVRPERRRDLVELDSVRTIESVGLEGDHRMNRKPDSNGKRHVTFFQWEHLPAIASYLGLDHIAPGVLRRNIGISGVNLLSLNGRKFSIGDARFEGTGQCHPCSRMQEIFGEGGYNAVRGHGGITARVLCEGEIRIGDEVLLVK
ncbi:MAG: MOSC domain-containing protein [Verrucomicrobiales bacterium]|nr:MOSC domain-containing protein [Verrucomicrobiales bacterium]